MFTLRSREAERFPRLSVSGRDYLYRPGNTLRLKSHQPPQPFGEYVYKPPFDDNPHHEDQPVLKSRSPRDHIFIKQALERDQENSMLPDFASGYFAEDDTITLRIYETLYIKDGYGAQVVACEVVRKPTKYWDKMGCSIRPARVVAKIFDPLFYPKVHSMAPWIRHDTVNQADKEYAREAAAYMEFHELRKTNAMIRDSTARYYGSWTMTIKNEGYGSSDTAPESASPCDNSGAPSVVVTDTESGSESSPSQTKMMPAHSRQVRVILLEDIDGDNIFDICQCIPGNYEVLRPPEEFQNQKVRLNILARLMRGIVAAEHAGIFLFDLDPRNFLICDESLEDRPAPDKLQRIGKFRVIRVGYSKSLVRRYVAEGKDKQFGLQEMLTLPHHPITRFDPDDLSTLTGWFPPEWLDDIEPYMEWIESVFKPDPFEEYTTYGPEENEAAGDPSNTEETGDLLSANNPRDLSKDAPLTPKAAAPSSTAAQGPLSGESESTQSSPESTGGSARIPTMDALRRPKRRTSDSSSNPDSVFSSHDDRESLFTSVGTLPESRGRSGSTSLSLRPASRLDQSWTASQGMQPIPEAGGASDEGAEDDMGEAEEEESPEASETSKGKQDD